MVNGTAPLHTDLGGLAELRNQASREPQRALEKAAKQFEALITQQMLKSMRATSFGSDGSGKHAESYKQMLDGQLAQTFAHSGRGLGIAEQLITALRSRDAQESRSAADKHSMNTSGMLPDRNSAHPAGQGVIGPSGPRGPLGPQGPIGPQGPVGPRGPGSNARSVSEYEQVGSVNQLRASAPRYSESTRYLDRSIGQSPAVHRYATTPLPAVEATSVHSPIESDHLMRARQFVDDVLPHADRAATSLGVPVRAILAHAALESGWGEKAPGNNIFGIKALSNWDGAVSIRPTKEFSNGELRTSREPFRDYKDQQSAFSDYVSFLRTNPRYAPALEQSAGGIGFLRGLAEAGYATDPNYAAKLERVYRSPLLDSALSGHFASSR